MTRLPNISNNVGSVKLFSTTLLRALPGAVLFASLTWALTTGGSFVIFRSASVRPKHLFDQNFDHDYLCELPLQGAGCPTKWTVFTSHHVRYRAVPRTNRTPSTANTRSRFATSSTSGLPA